MLKRAVASAAAALVMACGGSAAHPAATPSADPLKGQLTVLAAASLTAAFDSAKAAFMNEHRRVNVRAGYAGSPTLVAQIEQGAPADVFAAADELNMRKLVAGGEVVGAPVIFAKNQLQIVVAAGNPKGIRSIADLSRPGVILDVCAPQVPCGSYATLIFAKAGVRPTPRSQEQDVKSVVTKVSLGEADAGIVYTTDVLAGGAKVQGVDIPSEDNVIASYPIVQLRSAQNPLAARAFIDFVVGPRGQAILKSFGFASPNS